MRLIAVIVALLAFIAASRGHEETVRPAEVEESAVVVLLSGMSEIVDEAFDTPLADIAVSNDDSFSPVHVLGRRFGPFDGPPQDNFDFATQLLSFLTSRLLALDDFQSRINAAMTIRCPRMRQRALENILLEQYHTALPQQSSATGAMEPDFIGTADVDDAISSSSSSSGRWYPGIVDDITVEEPEFWDRFEINNNEKDIFYLDLDSEDDPPMEMPLGMPMPYPPHHHHHEHGHDDEDHHERHDHGHHDHFHHHHEGKERERGFKTKPLSFNPLITLLPTTSSSSSSSAQNAPQNHGFSDIVFSATVSTDFFDDDDFNGVQSRLGGGQNRGDEDDGEEQEFVNWELWNEDGSLNTGLILFIVLCCACAVVWSALLMQCARMSYSWVASAGGKSGGGGGRRGQFIFLPSESESDDQEEEDGGKWKIAGKKGNCVVIAAEYTKAEK